MKYVPKNNNIRIGSIFILLALLILTIYSNTFHAAFQFDDKPNIVQNARLHITDLHPSTLWQTFFTGGDKDGSGLYRPFACISLALNWYMGQDNPLGYHLVNICIHILTAFFLYLAISALLQTPKLKQIYNREAAFFIAALSTVLWAINPIQTQAVTYIVQRMASMAALFYVLGIFLYIQARVNIQKSMRVLLMLGCLLAFLSACMSKENAITFPVSVLFLEAIFFMDLSRFKRTVFQNSVFFGCVLVLTVCVGALVGLAALNYGAPGYGDRPFTQIERLLTEPRIVLFYISQIFYPLPSRLSIAHDIIISKSLFYPWTTLPAIMTIAALIGFALWQIRKAPLVAFAILFFFLNHAVESSVIALELIFEHRNYLPSLFLFLPIASGLYSSLTSYRQKNRFVYTMIAGFIIFLIIGWGNFTFLRNQAWKTEITLWTDAMQKAPNDARPPWSLATKLAWGSKPTPAEYQVALALLEKAKSLFIARDYLLSDIYNNIGSIYYNTRQYQKAVDNHKKGLELKPNFLKIRYDLVSALIMLGEWDEALEELHRVSVNFTTNADPDYHKLMGFILLWQQRTKEALGYLRKALKIEPNNAAVLLNTGVSLSLLGKYENAGFFLARVRKIVHSDIRPVLALIENAVRSEDQPEIDAHVEKLFAEFSIQKIIVGIELLTNNYRTAPLATNLVLPVIRQHLSSVPMEIDRLTVR